MKIYLSVAMIDTPATIVGPFDSKKELNAFYKEIEKGTETFCKDVEILTPKQYLKFHHELEKT